MARKKRKKAPALDPDIPVFSTGEVMKRAGVSRQVLYQYTAMGLIKEIATTEAGYRLYPESVFRNLKIIKALNERGYTLRDIKDIFADRLQPNG